MGMRSLSPTSFKVQQLSARAWHKMEIKGPLFQMWQAYQAGRVAKCDLSKARQVWALLQGSPKLSNAFWPQA